MRLVRKKPVGNVGCWSGAAPGTRHPFGKGIAQSVFAPYVQVSRSADFLPFCLFQSNDHGEAVGGDGGGGGGGGVLAPPVEMVRLHCDHLNGSRLDRGRGRAHPTLSEKGRGGEREGTCRRAVGPRDDQQVLR